MVEVDQDVVERFWEKVDVNGDDDCWEWQASTRRGYGIFWWRGSSRNAHRMAYTIKNNEQPEDFVLHKCDNPPCCNPAHLYDGTPSRNAKDWYERQDAAENFKGDSNPNSKLTVEEVKEIKRQLGEKSNADLADEYGVSRPAISLISSGVIWTDVEP